jgi:cation diffusion facilitator family transporter
MNPPVFAAIIMTTEPSTLPQAEPLPHPGVTGSRSTLWGLAVNVMLAGVKLAAGIAGNSYALVADAIESMADCFSSVIVWSGLRIAAKPPDENHPYGHGKAEPLAAAVVALGLVVAAAVIVAQSIPEIVHPHHAPAWFTLVVLLGVIATKEILFRSIWKVGVEVGSTAVKTDAWHHRSDALTSTAAFIGISIALVGGEGFEAADDWAALFASAVIAWNAWRLLKPAVAELVDTAPSPEVLERARASAATVAGVAGLEKSYVRKMGFDYYLDLHVLVNGDLSVREGHEIAHQVKDAVRRDNPRIVEVLVHIEPHDAHDETD